MDAADLPTAAGGASNDDNPKTKIASGTRFLRAEPAKIDLGTMSTGAEKSFTVLLRNTSDNNVTIEKFRSDCECLDLQVDRAILAPGETTELTGRFRAGSRATAVRKSVTLEVRAPKLQIVRVPIAANVVATLVVEPESVTLQPQFANGIAAECSVTIRNTGSDPIQLAPGKVLEHISVILDRETLRPGESATVRITAGPEFVCAENLRIPIQTSHPHETTLHIGLAVVPEPQLRLAPKVLRLGTATKKTFLEKPPYKILLWGAGMQEFEIAKVDSPSFLRAELPTPQFDRPREILFHGNGLIMHGALSGLVEIRIEHKATGKASVVKIPVSGTIAD